MHPRFSQFIITVLPVLLIGCANFKDRPLNAVASAARLEARSLSNPQLRQFIDSVIGHKKSWDIDSLTLAAIYYHPDVAFAQALADSAEAAITTAGQMTVELESAVAERAKLDVLVENQQAVSLLEDSLRYPIAPTFIAAVQHKP
jgi:hypothetical protein